ncbi:hypothetical protein SAMN04488564_1273 [Lentzea waywayandensis]|uniref:Uncharacterized protein n=1 Tax=Lentzea waywayandensis TaxID=84724 RepID=A0A1I6FJT4_9PSEU|nr:hypothetical protein [Lentzea waywayandensis]SFR30067.1 hypothetical protein SAMN04488564_1273 [Lentzea waywayandensis]
MDQLKAAAGPQAPLHRVTDWLHIPVWHEAKALVQQAEIKTDPLWTAPPLAARKLPLLLIGGLCRIVQLLAHLHDLMHRLNFRCQPAPIQLGLDCGEVIVQRSEDVLERRVNTTGQARDHRAQPRPTDQPGTRPGSGTDHPGKSADPAARRQPVAVRTAARDRDGRLARHARSDAHIVRMGFPRQVPFASACSRSDRIVDWRSCGDLVPESLTALVDELTGMLRQPHDQELTAS